MSHDSCSNLDAFLLDDLPAEAALRFTAHLHQCDSCRDAIDQQRWIDGLLVSPVCRELESTPGALIDSFCTPKLSRRRRARFVACAFATAAALAIAAGWTVLNREARHTTSPSVVTVSSREGTDPPQSFFIGGADLLVVPVASRHPNVTIVRIFPTYQPNFDTHAFAEPFEPDHFNGG
jgi:hypothetical protein